MTQMNEIMMNSSRVLGMTVSHANDSYFWVVTNFTGMDPQDGYRTQTMMTLIVGIVSMIAIFLASLVLL